MMSSGRDGERKILRERDRKKGQLAGQEDTVKNDGKRNGTERKDSKSKQSRGTAREKKGEGSGHIWGKKQGQMKRDKKSDRAEELKSGWQQDRDAERKVLEALLRDGG